MKAKAPEREERITTIRHIALWVAGMLKIKRLEAG